MLIRNVRVLLWFALQFTVAAGGALWARYGFIAGFAGGILILGATMFTLVLGWGVRRTEDALRPAANIVAIVGMTGFLLLLLTQQGLIPALGLLLLFAQLAMNLLIREYRQLYFGLVIGLVYVLGGAAQTTSGSYLLVFIVYALSVSFCLGEAWLDSKTKSTGELEGPTTWQRLRVVTEILALALVIYLLMPRLPAMGIGSQQIASSRFYRNRQWEQQAQRHSQSGNQKNVQSNTSSTSQPAEQAPASSTIGDQQTSNSNAAYGYKGFQSQFNISNTRDNTGSGFANVIVAYMKAPHGAYLKMRTFDHFDGARWSDSDETRSMRLVKRGEVKLQADGHANFRQVIIIKQTLPPWLPTASQPVKLWLPASVIALDHWQDPLLPGRLLAGTRYTVDSSLRVVDGRPFDGDAPANSNDLQLPAGFDPRISRLARQVTANAVGPLAKATALEQYLRTHYKYSLLSVFTSQGYTPLSRFLFKTRRGHCEYFASALAMMLRTIGIPSRLATGFSATQKNPLTGYYVIRALNGHAWVEARIRGIGWLTFEPTPAYHLPKPTDSVVSAQQINTYVKDLQRNDNMIGRHGLTPGRALMAIWEVAYAAVVRALAYLKLLFLLCWPWLLGGVVVIAALFATRRHWLPPLQIAHSRWQIRRYRPRQPREAIHFYLHHLQRIAGFEDDNRQPSESIDLWTQRMAAQWGGNDAWQTLAREVNEAFYLETALSTKQLRKTILAILAVLRTSRKT